MIVPQFSMYLCISLNVIADAIAFKHELVPPSGPIPMLPSCFPVQEVLRKTAVAFFDMQ